MEARFHRSTGSSPPEQHHTRDPFSFSSSGRDGRGGPIMARLSYAHGAQSASLFGETIGDKLRRTVERFGDREALVVRHQGYRATYDQLWKQSGQAARGLLAHGVQKG